MTPGMLACDNERSRWRVNANHPTRDSTVAVILSFCLLFPTVVLPC